MPSAGKGISGFFGVTVLAAAFLVAGCSSEPPKLEGAINADKIPVFPGAKLDAEQAIAGAELDRAFYAKYWDLTYTANKEDVVYFYRDAMPGAKVEHEDEKTTLMWDFPGAEEGEYIEIRVSPGEIHTVECLKLGKHAEE